MLLSYNTYCIIWSLNRKKLHDYKVQKKKKKLSI